MLNLGIIGLGSAGCLTVTSIQESRVGEVIAAADIDPAARSWFEREYDQPAYESVSALCARSDIDAIWVASPTSLHEEHAVMAGLAGKHVIVEKPMTFTLASAKRMIDACATGGAHLVCGGSRGSSATVTTMRSVVESGSLGQLRAMTSFAATDWMLRPRRPDEYDPTLGGGVVFRQAPHTVDSFRLLAGGLVRSVRAVTGAWMPERGTAPGFFTAILEFESGVVATCVYTGYGYFMASELFHPTQAGPLDPGVCGRVEARNSIVNGSDEFVRKNERLHDLRSRSVRQSTILHEPFLADIGLFVVHCEHGDLRQSERGLFAYRSEETEEILVSPLLNGPPELEELISAVERSIPIVHSGAWGMATLEVCLGIVESAQLHRDVEMREQVTVLNQL